MINNDVLRAIRYMLDLSDGKVVDITHLADPAFPISKEDVQAFLKKDDEPGYVECSNKVLAHFLDGLVIYRRGRDESRPPRPLEKRVTNNVVLKKLRVAFELKDVDMHEILAEAPASRSPSPSSARCSASPTTRTSACVATSCCGISSRA